MLLTVFVALGRIYNACSLNSAPRQRIYHSTDLLTARGVAHLVVHRTSGSTSYETIPDVRLDSSGDVLSTVDMVVQRRDGPRWLRELDDDDVHWNVSSSTVKDQIPSSFVKSVSIVYSCIVLTFCFEDRLPLPCSVVVPDALNTVHATRAQNVQLPCRTLPGHNVTWIQIEKTDQPFFRMYHHGEVYDWLQYRINISDARSGDFALNIYNIQVDDAGRYFCIAGFYEKPRIVLSASTYPASLETYDVYVEGRV